MKSRASVLKRLEYHVREERTALAPLIGPAVRLKKALSVTLPPLLSSIVWAFRSKEFTNFSYALSPKSLDDLADLLAATTGVAAPRMRLAIGEILEDQAFSDRLAECARASRWRRVIDLPIQVGRRAGWYALVRALRPRCVVEVGVEHGLGAAVLARALSRNASEGAPGSYLGIDRWEHAGCLLPPEEASRARIIRDEAGELPKYLDRKIDFLVYDAWPGFEATFYSQIVPQLSDDAVILSDDGHDNDELRAFARELGKSYLFFQETPERHWVRTGGIGIAFPSREGVRQRPAAGVPACDSEVGIVSSE